MTTIDRIRAMLVKDFKVDPHQLTTDARLEDLGIDSLGMAELVFNIEDAFGLTVPDAAVSLRTLGEVAVYIDELIVAHNNLAVPSSSSPSAAIPESSGLAP